MEGTLRIIITDTGGRKYSDYETQYISGEILTPDISNLPSGTYIITFSAKETGLTANSRFVVINNRD
jgi:hypothetical protein